MNVPYILAQWKGGECPREGDEATMNVNTRNCQNDFSCATDQLCVRIDLLIKLFSQIYKTLSNSTC